MPTDRVGWEHECQSSPPTGREPSAAAWSIDSRPIGATSGGVTAEHRHGVDQLPARPVVLHAVCVAAIHGLYHHDQKQVEIVQTPAHLLALGELAMPVSAHKRLRTAGAGQLAREEP